jgi:Ca-activated chloride channel family protein
MKIVFIILLIVSFITVQSQPANKLIQQGNEFYRQQQFDKAAVEYDKAIQADPQNTIAKFNLANSLQKQGKEDEAIKLFTEVAATTDDAILKAKAFYNKGAVLSKQKKLEESIEAYKDALRQNPEDNQARENLQKALLELKKKTPPKKKDDQQKKKKEQEQQKKQPQSKMSPKEAEQRLKLLEQKETEVQQRLQKEKSKSGGSQTKDW